MLMKFHHRFHRQYRRRRRRRHRNKYLVHVKKQHSFFVLFESITFYFQHYQRLPFVDRIVRYQRVDRSVKLIKHFRRIRSSPIPMYFLFHPIQIRIIQYEKPNTMSNDLLCT